MKLNKMKTLVMFVTISSAAFIAVGCSIMDSKKKEDNTALLYLVGTRSVGNSDQQLCLAAYAMANSCISGPQIFNPGLGCAQETLTILPATNGTITEQVTALRACVEAAVKDPIQPCNLPQFAYATAAQASAGVFKSTCKIASYAIAPATTKTIVDLTSLLKY